MKFDPKRQIARQKETVAIEAVSASPLYYSLSVAISVMDAHEL